MLYLCLYFFPKKSLKSKNQEIILKIKVNKFLDYYIIIYLLKKTLNYLK